MSNNLFFPIEKDENSILEIEIGELEIIGSASNLRDAYTNAFDNLKTNIYKKYNNFIVHLEPLDVIEIDDKNDLETKRILGFLPQKKLHFVDTLKIIFKVKYIKI